MQHSSLFNSIVKQNLSGLTNEAFLKQVTELHPYFTPAQFYLLQQMQEDNARYNPQVAKTAVLFNNVHWLNFQLQHAIEVNDITETPASTVLMPADNSDNDDDTVVIEDQLSSPEQILVAENSDNNDETAILGENQKLTAEQLMLAENSDNDDDAIMDKEITPIKINLSIPGTDTVNEDALAFEPMHLVDYFASQGIKLSEEAQPADKLGKQLKSFTDWLKTMKKIHVPNTGAVAGLSDIAIQNLAEKSNTEGEVVTESMAEVFTQQGKVAKAIEVYKKLSLLNPSKNAYFAAKIEQLKV